MEIIMKLKQMIAVLSSVAMLLCGCSSAMAKDQTYSDTLYDTVVKVQILDPVNENVMSGLKSLCQKYNTMFSMYVEGSDIYNINHAQGMPVAISSGYCRHLSKKVSTTAIYPMDLLISQLDLFPNYGILLLVPELVPDADAIASALSHVNYKNISVSDNTVQLLDPNASIDVGAIAKGYIADRIKDYLKKNGVKHAVIDLGGNILLLGSKTDGSKYNIGIQKPFGETGEPITSIKVANKSVVTTGIYQRYFDADGENLPSHS